MDKKLDSAQRKFNPQFGMGKKELSVNSFDIPQDEMRKSLTVGSSRMALKTPSTLERTATAKTINESLDDDAYTPEQFKASFTSGGQATDEQGNRLSILPGSSRPSKQRTSSTDKAAVASFQEESKRPA